MAGSGMRTLELSLDTADAIESIVETLRSSALKLAQENDNLRAHIKGLMREREELLEQLNDAREDAANAAHPDTWRRS